LLPWEPKRGAFTAKGAPQRFGGAVAPNCPPLLDPPLKLIKEITLAMIVFCAAQDMW